MAPQTHFKPVPEELWLRLAALEGQCHISLRRDVQWLVEGAGGRPFWSGIQEGNGPSRRVWIVRIFPKTKVGQPGSLIDGVAPHLADALLAAVEDAERRGWAPAVGVVRRS